MTTTTKTKKSQWPPIHKLTYTSGRTGWQVACMLKGKRIREAFPTRPEAETRAAQIRQQRDNEGSESFAMTTVLRVEAVKCESMLTPYAASLTEATTYYVEHILKFRNAPTVSEIVKSMVAESRSAGRRGRTIEDLRCRLERFARAFGGRQLSSISLEELKQWLDDPTQTARTRINYSIKLSQLFNYAIRHSWTETNLVERLTRPSTEAKTPKIFSIEQAGLLLEHAESVGLLPYVAIGLFAGIRRTELERLDWSAVKLSEMAIIVGADVAKTVSRRVVEINDTLAAWLTICGKSRGPVVGGRGVNKRLRTLAKNAGVTWQDNGLRHSFASYHLAAYNDTAKTAFQMGNSPAIVHKNYKALVLKSDAEKFFGLRPAADAAGKIVAMKAG